MAGDTWPPASERERIPSYEDLRLMVEHRGSVDPEHQTPIPTAVLSRLLGQADCKAHLEALRKEVDEGFRIAATERAANREAHTAIARRLDSAPEATALAVLKHMADLDQRRADATRLEAERTAEEQRAERQSQESLEQFKVEAETKRSDRKWDTVDNIVNVIGRPLGELAKSRPMQIGAGAAMVAGVFLLCVGARSVDFSFLGVGIKANQEAAENHRLEDMDDAGMVIDEAGPEPSPAP